MAISFPFKISKVTVVARRAAGTVTATARQLQFAGFLTGDNSMSISQFTFNPEYKTEVDPAFPFLTGYSYPVQEIVDALVASSYEVYVYVGDEGYQRAQGALAPTFEWSLGVNEGVLEFKLTADTTTYSGARQALTVVLRDESNNVAFVRTSQSTLPASVLFDATQASRLRTTGTWEVVFIFEDTDIQVGEIILSVDSATVIADGVTGNQTGVS